MAESERIALLIEQGLLHGVKLAGGREGTPVVAAGSWPLDQAAPPAEPAVDPAKPAETPSAPPGDDAFRQARTALKIDAGCALALPTDDLILRVLVLPPTDAETLAPIVRLQMEKIAPCSGEALSVGFEVLALEEAGVRVFAAAIPQEALDVWARRIADAGLRLTRIDAALLGWWRQLVDLGRADFNAETTAVLIEQGGRWDFILSERGEIRLARGFGVPGEAADLGRELMLTLLNHEMVAGAFRIDKLLVIAAAQPAAAWMDALAAAVGSGLKPQWIERAELGRPALGNARREGEAGGLDLIPAAWRSLESNRLTRRRFLAWVGVAAGLWAVLAALLLAAPAVVRRQTATANARLAAGEPAYRAVAEVRQRVRLIRSYMDRSQSLLEILREVCTVMPDGMEFGSITYRRGDAVKLVGDADQSARIYALKDALDAADRFESTRLNGPTLDAARRRYRFEIDARFKGGSE